jgi:hypothetical protein
MSPLLGGEFVIAFLALRIAWWIWRSRAEWGRLREGEPPGGPRGGLPQRPPRPQLQLLPPAPPAEPASLPRAA